jgi:hypothetical protein
MTNSIKYHLVFNQLMTNSDSYYARVEPNGTQNIEDIISQCLLRGTTLTETDLRAAIFLFMQECSRWVSQGYNVNTPLVNFKPTIGGTFSGTKDSFDPSRHEIKASASPGLEMIDWMKDAKPEKEYVPLPVPTVLEFNDANSGTMNTNITPGGIAILKGQNLKFGLETPEEGIFFIRTDSGQETKVVVVATRSETNLSIHIPTQLTPGVYKVEVRRSYTLTKSIRTGKLQDLLRVPG